MTRRLFNHRILLHAISMLITLAACSASEFPLHLQQVHCRKIVLQNNVSEPIRKAQVDIFELTSSTRKQVTVYEIKGKRIRTTVTDDDGVLDMSQVKWGTYGLSVVRSGHKPVVANIRVDQSDECSEHVAVDISPDVYDPIEGAKVYVTPLPISECIYEEVEPNLKLQYPTHVVGTVRDETAAPFKHSMIVVRRFDSSGSVSEFKSVITSEDGRFDLGEMAAGNYRVLASPNRGFAQPDSLECISQTECTMKITLKANPTDLPYAACPIK